jgi:hypothetical protein
MSFLKLDTRPTSAPVMPEGQYKLICTNAAYTLRNKEADITATNVKGLLCSFQFKANGKTGELVHNFSLFHADDAVRRMGTEDFGNMCKAMGFTIDSASGYALNSAGEIVEPKDIKGKTPNAHIIVKPHWQNPENWQNVVKSWVMPKDQKNNQGGETVAPVAELDNVNFSDDYDNMDVPF